MRTLIVGAGRIGLHLVRHLSSSEDNRLTVIEKKKERCKEISDKFDATIINGDATNPETLKAAEASNADLLIVATDDDRVNVATVKAGKKDFAIPKIVAVANSPKSKGKLKDAGADEVLCPVDLALHDLENVLSINRSTTLMYRSDMELKAVETTIPLNATVMGKNIQELKLPEKCRITLICREGSYLFPDSEIVLKSGDQVMVVGDANTVEQTVELLRSKEVV